MPTRPPLIGPRQIGLLEKLCNVSAVSGDEGAVREIVLEELSLKVDDARVDVLGNVLIEKTGRSRRRLRVMLDAHMDEVGFMLVADSGEGLYEFKKIGGLDAGSLAGKQVVVGHEQTPGVVGARPIHLSKPDELKHAVSADGLRVDLGLGGKAKVGDRGTFAPNFRRSGPSVMSKALDNRLGVATLIELVKTAPANVDLLAAFTVQEEIGLRGAQVAAQHFNPDVAIVVDATPANDLPMQTRGENTFYNSKLGLGPAIYPRDSTAIDDPRLVRWMSGVAERAKIPFQLRQAGGGGTDAGAIQRSGAGVPVVSVSVPHRYTHSAMSVARIEDWKNTLWLLFTALRSLSPDTLRGST